MKIAQKFIKSGKVVIGVTLKRNKRTYFYKQTTTLCFSFWEKGDFIILLVNVQQRRNNDNQVSMNILYIF